MAHLAGLSFVDPGILRDDATGVSGGDFQRGTGVGTLDGMLQLVFQATPPNSVAAVIEVSGRTYRFDRPGKMAIAVPESPTIELAIQWMAAGRPGTAYAARLAVLRGGSTLATSVFEGTIAPGGFSAGADRLFVGMAGEPGRGVPVPSATRPVLRRGPTPTRSRGDRAAPGDRAEYTVFYGTNRKRTGQTYTAERADAVEYGSCRVFIPKSHKIGSVGSPWWKRLVTMTDDRLKLLGITPTSAEEHWNQIRARLAEGEGDAVVFVHGYRVSFEEAAVRAAQIGFDLQVKGAMAFFSWPSQGTLDGYLADAASIEASEGMIADYLSDFAAKSGARTVHVIAHSMGNRGVLRAVNRIAAAAHERSGIRFGQFILAAADVDADTFRSLAAAYTRLARRTTLYVSERDRAVEASRWLHHFPRAGLIPPVLILPEIDTINVTNADLTMLGHGYVAAARDVLTDMHALIRHGHPPEERFGLREMTTETGERYWLIGA
jgi:esterase/lipase superfamily enzyme